jgi:hypothetical protein
VGNATLCLVATLLGVLSSGHARAEPALEALQRVAGVEQAMLEEARSRLQALAQRRTGLEEQVVQLRAGLSAALDSRDGPDHRRVNEAAEQLARAEGELSELWRNERVVVERIARHLERIEHYAREMETLETREEQKGGALSGTWEFVLMPAGQRGTAKLEQTGALVAGTYELEGGFSGSLQGTLVSRKVFLVRIDSKLGKSMEFEGLLSSDGQRIRGSWLNYELAGSAGASGPWTAQRQAAEAP